MNFKTTYILIATTLLLIGVLWFSEFNRSSKVDENVLLRGFVPQKVSAISITTTNGVVRLGKTGQKWKITEPIDYEANEFIVDALLGELELMRSVPIGIDVNKDLSPFGLAEPLTKVDIDAGDKTYSLRFGGKTVTGEQVYFMIADDPGIYLCKTGLLDIWNLGVDDWRDREFLPLGEMNYDAFDVDAGGQSYSFKKDTTNQTWMLSRPLVDRADNSQVTLLLDRLNQVRVQEFMSMLSTNLPSAPSLVLTFRNSTNILSSVKFGESPGGQTNRVLATHPISTNLVLVDRGIVDAFRRPFSDFRNRQLLSFSAAEIGEIEVAAVDSFKLHKTADGDWKLNEDTPADNELVTEFLNGLIRLRIESFDKDVVTDFAPYGLNISTNEFTLRTTPNENGEQTQIARLQLGSSYTNSNNFLVYARRNSENAVVSTSYVQTDELPTQSFELRDRKVWGFSTNSVSRIGVTLSDKTFNLVREGGAEWKLEAPATGEVQDFGIEEAVYQLGQLKAVDWLYREDSAPTSLLGISEPRATLAIETSQDASTQTHEINFGKQSPEGHIYAVTEIDGERIVFLFPKEVFELVQNWILSIPVEINIPE